MAWHGYFGIENINLNATQRATLIDALRALGPASDPQPCCLCHWRTRLDGDAAIFEALFSDNALTVDAWKNRLGAIFGVDPATVDNDANILSFSGGSTPVVVFSRSGTNYIRVALFGGVGATWDESRVECRGYLALYSDQWEAAD
jgi:hypothetical protein